MSVLAKDRRESPLRVLTHWMEVRIEFNRLFVFNFGYDKKKVIQAVRREYHVYEATDQMKPQRLELFKSVIAMNEKAALEILEDSKKFLLDGFRQVEDHIYIANTIYPTTPEELSLRRCHQDEALGICFSMMKELEFIMRAMPVHSEKFPKYIQLVNEELTLLKSWRSSNNKFNKVHEKSSRRKRKNPDGLAQVGESSDSQTTNVNLALSSETSNHVNDPRQANISANPTSGSAVPGGRPGYSKGYSYSTGYRQPHR